jgi:hypothetical protein
MPVPLASRTRNSRALSSQRSAQHLFEEVIGMFEDRKPRPQARRQGRPARLDRAELLLGERPVDRLRQLHQRMPMSMIASSRECKGRFARCRFSNVTGGITSSDSRETGKRDCKLLRPHTSKACNFKCRRLRKIDCRSIAREVLQSRLESACLGDQWLAVCSVLGTTQLPMPAN